MALIEFWRTHGVELATLVGQHVLLVGAATLVATLIGIPLGILAYRRPRIGRVVSAAASIVQTIPSLALFGFLLPLPLIGGLGTRTALAALVLYGVLPVFRGTASGLMGIDRPLIEAAKAMGLTDAQRLRLIELPLALPSIVNGVRVSTVIGVGTATIAAAIGAGGLGEYIFRGLSMVDATVILAGAIPAAVLALLADGLLALVERAIRRRRSHVVTRQRALAAAALLATIAGGAAALISGAARTPTVVVGSKNFTEQIVLGEIVAQVVERTTSLRVDRRLNLGGTAVCDAALRAGDLDVYVEYSGTALTALFRQPVVHDRAKALAIVRHAYASIGVTVGRPLGFNNTFAILVRGDVARTLGLKKIGDVAAHAGQWRAAFGYEFLEREDGFRGLAAAYGLRFRDPPTAMDLSLTYRALASRQVDLIAGDATAGPIAALDLTMLDDDRRYFPPYDAMPVVRAATLLRYPELGTALDRLAGRIDEPTMRQLNRAVDVDKRDLKAVVKEFVERLLASRVE
jgi:osmoprotectant transport system permease protein